MLKATKTTKKPKISVIVPIHNTEKFLEKSLSSVQSQTLNDIEIICVNDFSTDKSINILNEFIKKDSRFILINNEKTLGPGESRNFALKHANGEYIMFLDSDDWLEPFACEYAYERIKSTQTDICFFNHTNQFYDKNKLIKSKKSDRLNTFKNITTPKIELTQINNLIIKSANVWSQIYDRNFLTSINARFSHTKTCEDNPFFFNTIANASSISILDKELYNYRIQSEEKAYIKNYQEMLDNKKLAYEIISKSNKPKLLEMFIPYYWSSTAYAHFQKLINIDKKYKKIAYKELHNLAHFLNSNHNINEHKNRINLNIFNLYLKSNSFYQFKLNKTLLSLKNNLKFNNKNKNCLILNFWTCQNYGAILTCYGTYLLAKKAGLNPQIIKYFPRKNFETDYKESFTQKFANKYMNQTQTVSTNEEFIELNKKTNVFIAGSDQIWNPKIVRCHHENVSDGIYQLDFADRTKKKIAYATSFGTDFFNGTEEEIKNFKYRVKNFDAISIREDDGLKILQNEFNTKSIQLIDGAFHINKNILKKLTKPYIETNKNYIACFTLPYYQHLNWYNEHLNKISEENNLPLETMPFDKDIEVERWLAFIYNSKLIITDSYHAIVLAIIFNKPFIQIKNALAQSRFNSLYRLLKISPIIIDENTELKTQNYTPSIQNWKFINKKIKEEVKKAEKWLIQNVK